jgi:hypothetical protein
MSKINDFDFNVETKKILKKDDIKPRKRKKDIQTKKVLIGLTDGEYNKFYEEFIASGFPSESGFLKYKIKQANIV